MARRLEPEAALAAFMAQALPERAQLTDSSMAASEAGADSPGERSSRSSTGTAGDWPLASGRPLRSFRPGYRMSSSAPVACDRVP